MCFAFFNLFGLVCRKDFFSNYSLPPLITALNIIFVLFFLPEKTKDQVATQNHVSPKERSDAKRVYPFEACAAEWSDEFTRMSIERIPLKIFYGELQVGKVSQCDQNKRYKDVLKFSRKDFNIPSESWEQIAEGRAKCVASLEREQMTTKQRECAKLNESAKSAKPESRMHHQSQHFQY